MVQRKSFTNKCQRKYTNSLGKECCYETVLLWTVLLLGKLQWGALNSELGSLSKHSFICAAQSFTRLQPPLPVPRESDGIDQDAPFFPHTCEYQNPITALHYFSIDVFCQAFQKHLWVISDLCDILVYIFAFLLELPLMRELLLVVSASSG